MQRWFLETKGPLTQMAVQALRSRVAHNRSGLPPFRLPQIAQQIVAGLERHLGDGPTEAVEHLGEQLARQGLAERSLLAVHRAFVRQGAPEKEPLRAAWIATLDHFADLLLTGMSRWEIEDLHHQRDEMQAAVARAVQQRESELRRVIVELSTPIMPVFDQILVLPLVGSIDNDRIDAITEHLLADTVRRKARIIIIDITGVVNVDATIAGVLVRAARAVQLLGARTVLVGIRPELADVLTRLDGIDVDLSGLKTLANLQSGIEWALRQQGLAVQRLTPARKPGAL